MRGEIQLPFRQRRNRRVPARRQQAWPAPFAQHVRELLCQSIEERHPHRSECLVVCRLHPLSAIHRRQVVMMMLSVLRRRIVVMVIIIRAPQQRVMRAAIRDFAMTQSNAPGGKEPAE